MTLRDDIQRAINRAAQDMEDHNHDAGVYDRWAERAAKARDKAEEALNEALAAAKAIGFEPTKPKIAEQPREVPNCSDWSKRT